MTWFAGEHTLRSIYRGSSLSSSLKDFNDIPHKSNPVLSIVTVSVRFHVSEEQTGYRVL